MDEIFGSGAKAQLRTIDLSRGLESFQLRVIFTDGARWNYKLPKVDSEELIHKITIRLKNRDPGFMIGDEEWTMMVLFKDVRSIEADLPYIEAPPVPAPAEEEEE